jgi:hypothetical protein
VDPESLEKAPGLETQTSLSGRAGNFAQGGSTSNSHLLYECLLASQDLVPTNQHTNAKILVGYPRHTLDEMEQNGNLKITWGYGFSGFSMLQ